MIKIFNELLRPFRKDHSTEPLLHAGHQESAQVLNRSIHIARMKNGWGPSSTESSERVDFDFYIGKQGEKFLLSCISRDKALHDDSVHETISDAKSCAEDIYGISTNEWTRTPDAR